MQRSKESRSVPDATQLEWLLMLVAPCHSSARMRDMAPKLTHFAAHKQGIAVACLARCLTRHPCGVRSSRLVCFWLVCIHARAS